MPLLAFFNPQHTFATAEVRDVVTASQALGIREINLFRLAFNQWFGRPPRDTDIEPAFMHYLFAGTAPPWVRHFAREVLRRHHRGVLDPAQFGLPAVPNRAPGDDTFATVCRIALPIVWAVIVSIIAFAIAR